MVKALTGKAIKNDDGKPATDLLPALPLLKTALVFGFGKIKYTKGKQSGAYNYRKGKGLNWSRMYGAEMRHMLEWWNGREKDPETGMHPIYHALCELLMIADCIETKSGVDDRPI